jgi:hypothetical protein
MLQSLELIGIHAGCVPRGRIANRSDPSTVAAPCNVARAKTFPGTTLTSMRGLSLAPIICKTFTIRELAMRKIVCVACTGKAVFMGNSTHNVWSIGGKGVGE